METAHKEVGLTRRQFQSLARFRIGMTQIEIADELRISQQAVSKALGLAKKRRPDLFVVSNPRSRVYKLSEFDTEQRSLLNSVLN